MGGLEEVESEVISLWEDVAESRGFGRVLGRVLCTLLIEGGPLSQQDLADKTGYSIPTISRALGTLVSLGTGRKAGVPGSRLTLYSVELRPEELLTGGLMKWLSDAEKMRRRVSVILGELEQARAEDPARAEKLFNFLSRLNEFIPRMIEIMGKAVREIGEIPSATA